MLFWLILFLTIGSIVWWVLTYDEWSIAAPIVSVVMIVVLLISLCVFSVQHGGVDGFIAKNTKRYEMLVYQYENDVYDNDNDLGKRELMTDIQAWNEDLTWYKSMQNNFWIGIYIPDIFEQFAFIELKPQ